MGKAADLALYDLSHFRYQGLHERRLAPVIAGEPVQLKASFVNGRMVVRDGEVLNFDQAQISHDLKAEMQALFKRAG